MIDLKRLSFGCEHELADFNAKEIEFPCKRTGLYRDRKDYTVTNSNGVANDPSLKLYPYGGEICTPPTDTVSGQAEILQAIVERWPVVRVNYRCNMHVHVRVPGLSEDLTHLKRFARYNAHWLPIILPMVEPIPPLASIPAPEDLPEAKRVLLRGYNRRMRRRRVSHHTVLPPDRLIKQCAARTLTEFFEAEVPKTKIDNRPMWHAQPRAAVNLRQLREPNGTFEVRHWPETLDCNKLAMVGKWVSCYTRCALGDWGVPENIDPVQYFLADGGDLNALPRFECYQHDLEIRYRATVHDGSLPKQVIAENIKAILDGSFDDKLWEAKFKW